ncbi:MAG: DNA-binding NtrC family response regulator [Candidatus Paceibacteria bacterium]|jgi:DNA-binding NtrC family response regulator
MSRILVIDDDPGNRLIIKSRLSDQGYEVVLADTGADGLIDARTSAIDLCMVSSGLGSGIDAIEVCRRMKAMPEVAASPICIYSNLPASQEEITRGYEAGCEAFVAKADMPALDHILRVQLRNRSILEDLTEQNRVLDQHNRRLREEGQQEADREASRDQSGEHTLVLRELAANRPDGVLLVDSEGFVRSADRGACEIFGNSIERKNLGFLAPASGLEAFVRDARFEPRDGFRFDLAATGGRCTRSLTASVVPLLGKASSHGNVFKIVLLLDAAKRRIAAEMLRIAEPGIPRQQLGPLLDAAREVYGPELLVGESGTVKRAREVVESFKRRRQPVMLIGDRGVGKGRLARTAHYSGPFTGPFLQVACAGMTEENLERELFGYVKGAFPDALTDRPGLFQLAADGTVLLEDIDSLSPAMQARVLEVIDSGVAHRAGSDCRKKIDVGLMATCRVPLQEAVRAGQFSPELFDRFSENMAQMMPLAEREEDIVALAGLYVTFYGRAQGVRIIDQDAVDLLLRHTWPGNIPEFEACIREACVKAVDHEITPEHLPAALLDHSEGLPNHEVIPVPRREGQRGIGGIVPVPSPGASAMRRRQPWDIAEDDPISLDFYEKKALLRALDHVGGDKLAAARLLKVGKSTLYRKLKRFEIE